MTDERSNPDWVCGIERIAAELGRKPSSVRNSLRAGTIPFKDVEGEFCVRRDVLASLNCERQRNAARRARR